MTWPTFVLALLIPSLAVCGGLILLAQRDPQQRAERRRRKRLGLEAQRIAERKE